MLKDRCHQGLLPYFISSIIFLSLGLGFLLYYVTHFGANQLYSQGKILNQASSSGHLATQIIYIYPKSVTLKDRGTELYLVGYADKNNTIGYIGLEAKKNDSLIKRLYQNNDTLIDSPHRLEVEVLPLGHHFDKQLFHSAKHQLIDSKSSLGEEMDKTKIVSLALAKENRNRFYLVTLVCLGLGCLSLGIAYLFRNRNRKALEDFYRLYPEIDNSLEKAKSYANFIMTNYDILVYNNHLLTYGQDIRLLDLKKVTSLKQANKMIGNGKVSEQIKLPILYVGFEPDKSIHIRLKKLSNIDLTALFVYLNRYFPHILTDSVKQDTTVVDLSDDREIDNDELVIDLEELE